MTAQQQEQAGEGDSLRSEKEAKDSIRASYIEGFQDYFFIYPVLKRRSLSFELAKPRRGPALTYEPNNSYSLGVGLYMFELGAELAFAIPLREQSIERYGESKAQDVQLNILAKRWGLDAFLQRYTGFYIVDSEHPPAPNEPFPQRPDIDTRNFGLTGHYVFKGLKYSLRSAYNFAERQLHSTGSFIMLGSLSTFRVAADSSVVNSNRRADFGSAVDFTRLRYTTFSIAPGYTINLTYHHFFLNTMLAFGPAHHWINYDLEGKPLTNYDIEINTFFGARVAIGYNGDRLFGGLSYVSQGSTLKFDTAGFSSNNSVFKILVGYRFREFGVLRKRVWDILPFEI